MSFEDLEELVMEFPHGVRSELVHGEAVEMGDVELASHNLVASNLTPVHLGHFGLKSVEEGSESAGELGFSSSDIFLRFGTRNCEHRAKKVTSSVHNGIVPVSTGGIHRVEAEVHSDHADNGISFLEAFAINDDMGKASKLVGSFALDHTPFLIHGTVLERLSNVS
jgi:hypothetical protein